MAATRGVGRHQEPQGTGQRVEVRVADHVAKEERTTPCGRRRRRTKETEGWSQEVEDDC